MDRRTSYLSSAPAVPQTVPEVAVETAVPVKKGAAAKASKAKAAKRAAAKAAKAAKDATQAKQRSDRALIRFYTLGIGTLIFVLQSSA